MCFVLFVSEKMNALSSCFQVEAFVVNETDGVVQDTEVYPPKSLPCSLETRVTVGP